MEILGNRDRREQEQYDEAKRERKREREQADQERVLERENHEITQGISLAREILTSPDGTYTPAMKAKAEGLFGSVLDKAVSRM